MGMSCRSQLRCGLTPTPVVGLVGAAQGEELLLPLALSLEQMELLCCGFLCGVCFFFLGLLPVGLLCSLAARDGLRPSISPQHWGPAQLSPNPCPAGCRHLGRGCAGTEPSPLLGGRDRRQDEPSLWGWLGWSHLGWERESNPPPARGHQPMSPCATSGCLYEHPTSFISTLTWHSSRFGLHRASCS